MLVKFIKYFRDNFTSTWHDLISQDTVYILKVLQEDAKGSYRMTSAHDIVVKW